MLRTSAAVLDRELRVRERLIASTVRQHIRARADARRAGNAREVVARPVTGKDLFEHTVGQPDPMRFEYRI